jgi:hypothetical protein
MNQPTRTCVNCRHADLSHEKQPCYSCHQFENWVPASGTAFAVTDKHRAFAAGAAVLHNPPTGDAPGLLDAAAGHMRDRAAIYDKPGGERSMAQTVAAFNAITGKTITEAEGWLLMAVLKMVRAQTRAEPHRDSIEDLIAYGALFGEARLRGR